jgi:sugar/nucleoside kinase (ribokinase family)
MSFLVVGSVAFDTIETPFGKAERVVGGSATFISLTASYFTDDVKLIGIVGNDFPKNEIEFLSSKGIDVSGLEIHPEKKSFFWHGKYHYDLNTRDTLVTELNVLEDFNPIVPDAFKDSKYICLGNIVPALQQSVIKQLNAPKLIAIDTMNFWIESAKDDLIETLKLVNIMIINDSEARELTGEYNLVSAARKILSMGPRIVVIKKGEHGALLFTEEIMFSAPAYPLETVYDPTGAGDTFAGGFMGWLAKTGGSMEHENLRLAMIYGSAMASICVEKFSIDALRDLDKEKITNRFREFLQLTRFENIEI